MTASVSATPPAHTDHHDRHDHHDRADSTASAALRVFPLGPVLGAEIDGLDLAAPLRPPRTDELRRLLAAHKVLLFRGQSIDAAQQLALGRSLGSILDFAAASDPDHPGVHLASTLRQPVRRGDGGRATGNWHIDGSGFVAAPFASILRPVTLPPLGGDTVWADLAAAYEGLPSALRTAVEDLYVTHDVTPYFRDRGIDYPLLARPIVRTHPETGQRVLHVNFALRPQVVGWSAERSTELLAALRGEATRPEYQLRFRWTADAVALWDNRAVHHYPVRDYGDFPRRMDRV
ncbi:TauD/TfdA family dioxygenase [Frankia sp. AiPs1]|uniref:TauD/TfdA dioxygenase family protein n=1 Tax=Frankia sp. AiPs1 TaxID=573493 RepID=UPI0020433818|nr:TauD/TfdA family dioxygenase [Frankia sp. AiPs1]MCM3922385.1 TauD/TfdA family dioxygenase [Frankia sp. AiPs1]